jgi:hypothetical protein
MGGGDFALEDGDCHAEYTDTYSLYRSSDDEPDKVLRKYLDKC